MSENASIFIGGLTILVGVPIVGGIAWILWTYPMTNLLFWGVLGYLIMPYDSAFVFSRKSWWTKI